MKKTRLLALSLFIFLFALLPVYYSYYAPNLTTYPDITTNLCAGVDLGYGQPTPCADQNNVTRTDPLIGAVIRTRLHSYQQFDTSELLRNIFLSAILTSIITLLFLHYQPQPKVQKKKS